MPVNVHISVRPDYERGDPAPTDYSDWHEWARVQTRSGLRQVTCAVCGKWWFPQELSDRTFETKESWGIVKSPMCKHCGVCVGRSLH